MQVKDFPNWKKVVFNDRAILKADTASSLLPAAIKASTFLTKVLTRLLLMPLIMLRLSFLLILVFADL